MVKLSAHLAFALSILIARQITTLNTIAFQISTFLADYFQSLFSRKCGAKLLLLDVVDILAWRRRLPLCLEVAWLSILLIRAMGTFVEGTKICVNIWLKTSLKFHHIIFVLWIIIVVSGGKSCCIYALINLGRWQISIWIVLVQPLNAIEEFIMALQSSSLCQQLLLPHLLPFVHFWGQRHILIRVFGNLLKGALRSMIELVFKFHPP